MAHDEKDADTDPGLVSGSGPDHSDDHVLMDVADRLPQSDDIKEKSSPEGDDSQDSDPDPDPEADEASGHAAAITSTTRERQAPHRSASVFSRTLTPVARNQRRGLFGRLAIIPEVESPYDYKNSTKWVITAIVALAGAAAPIGSSIFYRACYRNDIIASLFMFTNSCQLLCLSLPVTYTAQLPSQIWQ